MKPQELEEETFFISLVLTEKNPIRNKTPKETTTEEETDGPNPLTAQPLRGRLALEREQRCNVHPKL